MLYTINIIYLFIFYYTDKLIWLLLLSSNNFGKTKHKIEKIAKNMVLIIGVAGHICSGKSEFVKYLHSKYQFTEVAISE